MSDPRGPLDEWETKPPPYLPTTVNCIKLELEKIAVNFEMRARNIATHNQRSHTSNTQQRQNMTVMYNTWTAAAEYVRAQAKTLGTDNEKISSVPIPE